MLSVGNQRNMMKLRHASILFGLFLLLISVSFAGCADDDGPGDTEVDCAETPDDPACDTDVDCKETPEDPACLFRPEVDKYNVRRCPELEDDAHEVLRYNDGFEDSRNLARMTEFYNKSYGSDTLVHPGESQTITGRFWSGRNNIPGAGDGPEGEDVVVFRQSDDAWEVLGEGVTDKDGIYEVDVPAGEEFPRGDHRILSVLKADGTCVEHGVFVYEKAFETILTDIDATLTTLDQEMLDQMLGDLDKIPAILDHAVEMTNLWDSKGYLMLYLSARPHDYLSWTRIWLREQGFPYGPSQSANGLVHGHTAALYKEGFVQRVLEDLEWNILYGYGNAFSDVDGYLAGGIPAENCFMVNEAGCPSEEDAATKNRNDKECICYVGSEDDACDKFDDLDATPYNEQKGVAYRRTNEIDPNNSYETHIDEFVQPHDDSNTPK